MQVGVQQIENVQTITTKLTDTGAKPTQESSFIFPYASKLSRAHITTYHYQDIV